MRRQKIFLIAVLVLGALALGRWLMLVEDAVDAPPAPAPSVQVEPEPAATPAPAVAEAEQVVEEKAPPPEGAILRGRVVDVATREPVRKFTLQFHWDRSTGAREAPPAKTFETDDGRFEWETTPGVWALIATARGYQRFELEGLQLKQGATTQEILVPLRHGHTVQGRVYDEASGAGIAAASVNFRESETHRFAPNWRIRQQFAVRTKKNGSFVLDGVAPGRTTLSAYADGYAGREVEVVVGDETEPVEIALFVGGSISGRLTAADGVTPIAGSAGLYVLDEGHGSSSRTKESGEFSFSNLPPGRYRVTGQSDEGSAEQEITLAANERIEGIVLALGGGYRIRGVVTGVKPEDLERVRILWHGGSGGPVPSTNFRVDARGAYELRGVPPGRIMMSAEIPGHRLLSRTVEMPRDRDLTVNFEFPRGARLSGRVTHRGKPVVGQMVNPREPKSPGELFLFGARTNEQGQYVIEDLPPGEYFIRINNYRSRLFKISDDMVFDMDVPGAQLTGRVVEDGGKVPVAGAEVVIWWAEDPAQIRQYSVTDQLGRFLIVGLEPGEFVLSAHKSGHELYREPFSYSAPVSDMTIRLRQGTGVEARVLDAISGKPLRSMDVHAVETIGGRHGISFNFSLDENGVGYVPAGLAGSTLSFGAAGYSPAEVRDWSGDALRLKFAPEGVTPP
jgi:hypothetical protein